MNKDTQLIIELARRQALELQTSLVALERHGVASDIQIDLQLIYTLQSRIEQIREDLDFVLKNS
jgi:hypothetical protein